MAESGQEFTGKSVDEAVAEGLAQLQLRADQVDIEVLSKGSRGIFGLGSEPARVRIAPRAAQPDQPGSDQPPSAGPSSAPESTTTPAPPPPSAAAPAEAEPQATAPDEQAATTPQTSASPAAEAAVETGARATGEGEEPADVQPVSEEELTQMATELLGELVQHMGFDAEVETSWHEPDEDNEERYLRLNIQGEDVSALIGRRGEALASVQYLLRLMINQRIRQWKNIVVDVDRYKERRVNQLTQLANRMAEQVASSGRAVSLEPMPPNERRIVHMALRDHPQVYTQSSGEGDRRKVHIVARD